MSSTISVNPFKNKVYLTQEAYKNAETNDKKKALYKDVNQSTIAEIERDSIANKLSSDEILQALQNTNNKDKKACTKAKNKASKLAKNSSFFGFTLTSDAKVKNNTLTTNIKNEAGKGTLTLKYTSDGSYSINTSIKDSKAGEIVTAVSLFDANGKIR